MSSNTKADGDKPESAVNIAFKSIKKKSRQRNFRSRRDNSDEDETDTKKSKLDQDDEEEFNLDKLEETKELQKLRQRSKGVSHVTLASGVKMSKVEEEVGVDASDPFKLKTGGLLDLAKAKQAKALEDPSNNEKDLTGVGDGAVGTQFSRETRVRDEDEEMRKFIEAEMEKRKRTGPRDEDSKAQDYLSPEDKALKSLPDHLRKSTFRKNEEMLSSQMLSGIPEVDLGIEEKIRNIEATEEAKKKMAEQQARDKASGRNKSADFVPSNLAVNFRRPDRFKSEMEAADSKQDHHHSHQEQQHLTQTTVNVGSVPVEKRLVSDVSDASSDAKMNASEKATDDMHLTKFKQHFHRK